MRRIKAYRINKSITIYLLWFCLSVGWFPGDNGKVFSVLIGELATGTIIDISVAKFSFNVGYLPSQKNAQ